MTQEKTPIVLMVYNRLNHTEKVIEALKQNPESKESVLYVYSDAPKKEEDINKVELVREYLEKIRGFKEIHIIPRDKNYGVTKNMVNGVTEVVNKHGRVIVLEDDDVPSKYFLKYMNEALEMYKNNDEVGAISGFLLPLKEKLPESFFLYYFNSWGWATWSDRWIKLKLNGKELLDEINQKNLGKQFDINNKYPFTRILRNQIRGFSDSWSIRWYATLFLNEMLTLYPGRSLVKNVGFDDTGTHGQNRDIFETSLTDRPIELEKKEKIEQDKKAYKALQNYFKSIFWERLSGKIKRTIKNPIKEFKNI